MSTRSRIFAAWRAASARKVRAQLLSWGLPILWWLFLAAVYSPGLTNGDSQQRWLQARAWIGVDPGREPADWFSPFLISVRAACLKLGGSYSDYHYLFLAFTVGAWAYAVAGLLESPWKRALAHLGLLLTPLGLALAIQAADLWVSAGLLLIIGSLARLAGPSLSKRTGTIAAACFLVGCGCIIGGRYNGTLMIPVLAGLPWLFPQVVRPVRWRLLLSLLCLAAFAGLLGLTKWADFKKTYKTEVYMAYEILGMWKYARPQTNEAPPETVARLPAAESFLDQWDATYSDPLMWGDRRFRGQTAALHEVVRRDYGRSIARLPGAYFRIKVDAMAAGWGFTPQRAPILFRRPPQEWLEFINLDLEGEPWSPALTTCVDKRVKKSMPFWNRVWRPWQLTLGLLAIVLLRLIQRRTDAITAIGLILFATYAATILPWSFQYIPRYFFPCGFLGLLIVLRLLLQPPAGRSGTPAQNAANARAAPASAQTRPE